MQDNKVSVLGLEYLCLEDKSFYSSRFGSFLYKPITSSFYINKNIEKSSIGEYYSEKMNWMMREAGKIYEMVMAYLLKNRKDLAEDEIVKIANKFHRKIFPLGAVCCIPDYSNYAGYHFFDSNILGINSLLPEVRNIFDECKGYSIDVKNALKEDFSCDINKNSNTVKARINKIEKISRELCVGFTPKDVLDPVSFTVKDMGHLETYYIASMLYPFVTQSFDQLQLLVTTLPRPVIDDIIDNYVFFHKSLDKKISIGKAFCNSNEFVFDIHSDYMTYASFLIERDTIDMNIQRQCWTPFFGFEYPKVLESVDDEIRKRVDACVKQSYKLYVEMLKTGLTYESQYATLMGFRGRFYVSMNFFDLYKSIIAFSNGNSLSFSLKDIASSIRKRVASRFSMFKGFFEKDN